MLEAVVAVLVVAAVAAYATWLAGRLDRLEARIEAARQSLDAQLVRRAAAAERFAGTLAPSQEQEALRLAARAALDSPPAGREAVESGLSRVIRAAVTDDAAGADVVAAGVQVQLARQFHNDAVHSLRALRGRRIVRALRLSARRAEPAYFEFDDAVTDQDHPGRPG